MSPDASNDYFIFIHIVPVPVLKARERERERDRNRDPGIVQCNIMLHNTFFI